jgi:hypothetical protein
MIAAIIIGIGATLVAIGLIVPMIFANRCDHMWMTVSRDGQQVLKKCHHCQKTKTEIYP